MGRLPRRLGVGERFGEPRLGDIAVIDTRITGRSAASSPMAAILAITRTTGTSPGSGRCAVSRRSGRSHEADHRTSCRRGFATGDDGACRCRSGSVVGCSFRRAARRVFSFGTLVTAAQIDLAALAIGVARSPPT